MSSANKDCKIISGFSPSIYHCGPSFDLGPLPSLFYFALTGEESLTLDPFNQPVALLAGSNVRVFSLTLPGHGQELSNHLALAHWAKALGEGQNIITDFVNICKKALDFLTDLGYIDPHRIAVAGLSRGAFIAAHFAAADERAKTVLCFSPLTRLDTSESFKGLENDRLVNELSLLNLTSKLASKTLRSYIGNRDTLVGTENCFAFIKNLAEEAHLQKHRHLPIELFIYPSIGHKGHGTPPHIFRDGIDWLQMLF